MILALKLKKQLKSNCYLSIINNNINHQVKIKKIYSTDEKFNYSD